MDQLDFADEGETKNPPGPGFDREAWKQKQPKAGEEKTPDGGTIIRQNRQEPGNDGGWSQMEIQKDKDGNTIKVVHRSWTGKQDPRVDKPDHEHVKYEKK